MSEQTSLTVTEEELSRIHQYTRRPMAAEELYTFTVVLCDNEVDRDYERFSVEALQGAQATVLCAWHPSPGCCRETGAVFPRRISVRD